MPHGAGGKGAKSNNASSGDKDFSKANAPLARMVLTIVPTIASVTTLVAVILIGTSTVPVTKISIASVVVLQMTTALPAITTSATTVTAYIPGNVPASVATSISEPDNQSEYPLPPRRTLLPCVPAQTRARSFASPTRATTY